MNSIMKVLLLTFWAVLSCSNAVLDTYPITFQMGGPTTYVPDSGGPSINGYTLTIGYTGHSWLAVQLNGGITSDILVLQINDFYSSNVNPLFNGHQVTVANYHYSSSGGLVIDSATSTSLSSYTYTLTKAYELTLTRSTSSNGGQDWDAVANKYSVLNACFYSSSLTFNPATFNSYLSVCYNYEIDNFVSTFVGTYLKTTLINGYATSLYGWIDGPSLTANVYFYQNTPLFTYVQVPAVMVEIGTTDGQLGQDFYAWSPIQAECGDFYGEDSQHLAYDNSAKGYSNPSLTLKHWNAVPASQIPGLSTTSLRITFSRAINTYDSYDKTLYSTFIFCMYIYLQGSTAAALSSKQCNAVELSYSFVQMPISSGLFEVNMKVGICLILLILLA